ncbi:hypothetical protein [Hanstruepera ponticola]|uniref:hypothetical protein n=1 Tax=Hanstruepera ponticola TaxID=2042995 RepID=UPI0037422A78
MVNLPISYDELIQKANDLNLYCKLINQLNKDFGLANIQLEFDETVLPTSLKLILHETIYKLIQEKFMEYLNLLYIIDVPEKKVKQLDSHDMVELSEHITFLILQREWQKVWYRNNY